ncbi:MAG: hypothetical protein LUE93_16105 [Bacteroides sp.]|nr:hypothetical protein [Bacteroides sp.]
MKRDHTKALTEALASFLLFMLAISCTDQLDVSENELPENSLQSRAVETKWFDWENADWMPTPAGQSQIPSPWVGSSSLTSLYGMDIMNDRKAVDGWELLYSSFDENASGPLTNPYFVLYNKYNGLMRIFLYTTTQFVATSSYLQDGLTVVSNRSTSLLSYLGQDIITTDNKPKNYFQFQPIPGDGTRPLASNKWYMFQYEMAYDPSLAGIPHHEMQLSWTLNYYDVTDFSFEGTQTGELKAIMGSSSQTTGSNILTAAGNFGTQIGTGALAGAGQLIVYNNEIENPAAGQNNNSLGLPNFMFNALKTGVDKALSGTISSLAGTGFKLLSAIFGGGKNKSPVPVNYTMSTTISFKGTGTNSGSFPSMPLSFWVPGTDISKNAVGYIPYYNKPLGVVYMNGTPTVPRWVQDPNTIDLSDHLVFNPAVLEVATVKILQQDLIKLGSNGIYVNEEHDYSRDGWDGIRLTIEVKPKDGSAPHAIIKTFKVNTINNGIEFYYYFHDNGFFSNLYSYQCSIQVQNDSWNYSDSFIVRSGEGENRRIQHIWPETYQFIATMQYNSVEGEFTVFPGLEDCAFNYFMARDSYGKYHEVSYYWDSDGNEITYKDY